MVRRLAALFAVDAAGGGLVTTGFLSYYLAERYHVSVARWAGCFSPSRVVQAVSVALAPLLARRFGLIATMVGTHLPSNVLLAAVAFAPTFPRRGGAAAGPHHAVADGRAHPAGAGHDRRHPAPSGPRPQRSPTPPATPSARSGPLIAGLVQQLALGAPLVLAGAVKAGYDLALWGWARHLGLASRARTRSAPAPAEPGRHHLSGEPS